MQDDAHSENEGNLEKEEVFNNVLEAEISDIYLKQKPPKCAEKWNKRDIINNKFANVPPPQWNQLDQVTPTSLFELFFDDEVVNFMVDMTNLYAQRDKGKHKFTTDANEMHLFLAMLLLTDYNQLPRRKMC